MTIEELKTMMEVPGTVSLPAGMHTIKHYETMPKCRNFDIFDGPDYIATFFVNQNTAIFDCMVHTVDGEQTYRDAINRIAKCTGDAFLDGTVFFTWKSFKNFWDSLIDFLCQGGIE